MTLQEKQLGQLRPSNTTAASIYSPGAGVTTIVKQIYVTNTSSTGSLFRIFVDDDGSTYDQSTAIFWDVSIDANTTVEISTFIAMNNSAGNLAVRTSQANTLTFSIFGAEVS
jgi:hypothetical protein